MKNKTSDVILDQLLKKLRDSNTPLKNHGALLDLIVFLLDKASIKATLDFVGYNMTYNAIENSFVVSLMSFYILPLEDTIFPEYSGIQVVFERNGGIPNLDIKITDLDSEKIREYLTILRMCA